MEVWEELKPKEMVGPKLKEVWEPNPHMEVVEPRLKEMIGAKLKDIVELNLAKIQDMVTKITHINKKTIQIINIEE